MWRQTFRHLAQRGIQLWKSSEEAGCRKYATINGERVNLVELARALARAADEDPEVARMMAREAADAERDSQLGFILKCAQDLQPVHFPALEGTEHAATRLRIGDR